MKELIRKHLSQLEGEPGVSLDELKVNFRRLSFIWHPDRQPVEYRDLAEEKLQKINQAFDYFEKNPELLLENLEEEPEEVFNSASPFRYDVHPIDCKRCEGSGQISMEVDQLGRFTHETCPICHGKKQVLVDERNRCRDCHGTGTRPHLHDTDQEAWIDREMSKRGWLERHLHPIFYKRTWLRYQKEVVQCSSCSGAGFFYFRQDSRAGDRRGSSVLDFLHELQGSEMRDQDRRKSASA